MVVLLKSALEHRGHEVVGVHGGAEALAQVRERAFDVVLTDLRMEPVGGLEVLAGVRETSPDTAVVILTAYGEVETAVAALQQGAYHFLTKPVNFQAVAHVVEQAVGAEAVRRENAALRRVTGAPVGTDDALVGEAAATRSLREMIGRVAPSDATVLIRGESGTGKELAARAIHARSGRSDRAFVPVNCAAIAETLLESELFGYRKGAFTGADSDREGLFEAAHGGTVFLDEIGEAGPAVQAKLLRVLEERRINRVGDPREREVDVRIIAATNRPLEEAIAARTFREDLYYRLLVFPLDVPPLRERADDIPLLTDHFLRALGRRGHKLPAGTMARMRAYKWPGNVRELRNLVERAHILAGDGPVGDEHVLLDVAAAHTGEEPGADLNLDNNARRLIAAALQRAGGNKSRAARMLGITRRTLYSRLSLLGMDDGDDGEDENAP
ncbi:sigma-54-dependent Fis family transcriptional regulator [bacterium]|nr:sigma-54-dependent Fis family transcriptional regulator [bacterium]